MQVFNLRYKGPHIILERNCTKTEQNKVIHTYSVSPAHVLDVTRAAEIIRKQVPKNLSPHEARVIYTIVVDLVTSGTVTPNACEKKVLGQFICGDVIGFIRGGYIKLGATSLPAPPDGADKELQIHVDHKAIRCSYHLGESLLSSLQVFDNKFDNKVDSEGDSVWDIFKRHGDALSTDSAVQKITCTILRTMLVTYTDLILSH